MSINLSTIKIINLRNAKNRARGCWERSTNDTSMLPCHRSYCVCKYRIWWDFRENNIVNFNRKFEQDDFCRKRIKIESFLAKLGKIFSNFRRSQLMASSKHLRFVEINRHPPVLVAIFFALECQFFLFLICLGFSRIDKKDNRRWC